MLKFRRAALAAALVLPASLALAPPAIAQQKTTIGVSLAQDDNPFYIAMLRGIRARAQELGWEVATVSANEDKLKQINGVQDLVARGVKGILISPIDAVGVNAAYDAAAAAKVPIVSVARGSASPNQTIHVAMDEKQIGRDIAEWTAKKLGGKGKVALLMGPSGAPTFRNLGDGYAEVMAKHPGIQIVIKHDGPLTRERGVKQAEDALVAHPDLAAIYTANDDVALGAMQAVNAANRKGKTLVTGMNGVPPALRAVKEENLAMTVELNPVRVGPARRRRARHLSQGRQGRAARVHQARHHRLGEHRRQAAEDVRTRHHMQVSSPAYAGDPVIAARRVRHRAPSPSPAVTGCPLKRGHDSGEAGGKGGRPWLTLQPRNTSLPSSPSSRRKTSIRSGTATSASPRSSRSRATRRSSGAGATSSRSCTARSARCRSTTSSGAR